MYSQNTGSTWSRVEGKWEQLKGNVRQKWGKLTDDDVALCKGNREKLIGMIMERYGCSREQAETQVASWERGV